MPFQLLHPELQRVLKDIGITSNPGQDEYIPAILRNEDILISASTGTGKTFGTIIAVINRILEEQYEPISVLIITPLKALNRDIFRRVLPSLAQRLDISISIRHGDTSQSERQKQSKNPPQILITTPELFQALLPAKVIGRQYLPNVKTVIIDEIHELVNTKRGVQLSIALERLRKRTKSDFQRIGLSATIGSPKKIGRYLTGGKDPTIVKVSHEKRNTISIEGPDFDDEYSNLEQIASYLQTTPEAAARILRIITLVKNSYGTTLFFTNTRQQAEIMAFRIAKYNEIVSEEERITYYVHHSSLSQQSRLEAERQVREEKIDLIIATSSLELGIDIGQINQVIQYMSPRRIETLLQRIGRSGHSLSGISRGIIITENIRDTIEAFVIVNLGLSKIVEPNDVHPLSLDILFQGIIGILLDFGQTAIDEIFKIIKGSYIYKNLTKEQLEAVITFGLENHYFWINEIINNDGTTSKALRAKRRAYQLYYSKLSTIPDKKTYQVIDVGTRRRVGILDEKFVSVHGDKESSFVLNGVPWRWLRLRDDDVIEVTRLNAVSEATIPTWEGELIPVSFIVSSEVLKLFEKGDLINNSLSAISNDQEIKEKIANALEEQRSSGILPSNDKLIIENKGNVIVIHSFLGSKGNETFGMLISGMCGAKIGTKINYRSDPYSVVLTYTRGYSLPQILLEINPEFIEPLIRQLLLSSDIFSWKIIQVASRFGLIEKNAEISPMLTRLIVSKYSNTVVGEEAIREIIAENLNIPIVTRFFEDITTKKVKIVEIPVKNLSLLGMQAIRPISNSILKLRPPKTIIDAVEKRILQTWVRLVCMNPKCKWEKQHTIQSLNNVIECPRCHSHYIAVVHKNLDNIKGLLRRSINKNVQKKLTEKEIKDLTMAKKSADLILSFGRKAAFVLAGKGIGPTTAARILREPHKNHEELILAIIRQESEYAKNREYWN